TALAGADADATGSDTDRVIIVPTIIVPVAVTAELNVYSLGFGRSNDRRSRQYCYGCRRDESDLHHEGFLLWCEDSTTADQAPFYLRVLVLFQSSTNCWQPCRSAAPCPRSPLIARSRKPATWRATAWTFLSSTGSPATMFAASLTG